MATESIPTTPHQALGSIHHAIAYLAQGDSTSDAMQVLADRYTEVFDDAYPKYQPCQYPMQADSTGENADICGSDAVCDNEDCGLCKYHCKRYGCGKVGAA